MSSKPGSKTKPKSELVPILLGSIFVAVFSAAGVFASYTAGQSLKEVAANPPAPAETATDSPKPEGATEAAATATPAGGDDLKAVKAEVEALTKHFEALTAKIEGLPKPEGADLKPIQAKIEELAALSTKLDGVMKKLDTIDEKTQEVAKAGDESKGEIAALKAQLEKVAAAPETKPATAATGVAGAEPVPAVAESKLADITSAVALFKANKFPDARASLIKLQESNPTDARVWYYSALSNGFATNKWDGVTLEYVSKGVACEKAGTPETAQIDAAFADLPAALGKDWLASYRARAK